MPVNYQFPEPAKIDFNPLLNSLNAARQIQLQAAQTSAEKQMKSADLGFNLKAKLLEMAERSEERATNAELQRAFLIDQAAQRQTYARENLLATLAAALERTKEIGKSHVEAAKVGAGARIEGAKIGAGTKSHPIYDALAKTFNVAYDYPASVVDRMADQWSESFPELERDNIKAMIEARIAGLKKPTQKASAFSNFYTGTPDTASGSNDIVF